MTGPWIAAFIAVWVLVMAVGLLVLGTLRRLLPVLAKLESAVPSSSRTVVTELAAGSPVPAFVSTTIGGEVFGADDLSDSTIVLLFLDSSCRACDSFVSDLEAGRAPGLGADLVVVSESTTEAHRLAADPRVTVLVEESGRSVAAAFHSERAPEAFVLRAGRVVGHGIPNDWRHVREIVRLADDPIDLATRG